MISIGEKVADFPLALQGFSLKLHGLIHRCRDTALHMSGESSTFASALYGFVRQRFFTGRDDVMIVE